VANEWLRHEQPRKMEGRGEVNGRKATGRLRQLTKGPNDTGVRRSGVDDTRDGWGHTVS
jgi:hypothetical protein